jgi:hypothetical protein
MTAQDRTPPRGPGRLVLVDVDNGSYRELAPDASGASSWKRSVPGAGPRSEAGFAPHAEPVLQAADPWQVAHNFPDRWRGYLHAHFRNHMAVAQAFQVSEKAARKWWEGIGSCRADKAAVAMVLHPASAPQMLFGIAAE